MLLAMLTASGHLDQQQQYEHASSPEHETHDRLMALEMQTDAYQSAA